MSFNNFAEHFNFKFKRLINLGLGLTMIDGGNVIAIQIIDFLLCYFFMKTPTISNDGQSIAGIGLANLLIAIIGILNLAVIIYRITGLASGTKYSLAQCYGKCLRFIPAILLLYVLGSMTILAVSLQFGQMFLAAYPESTKLATMIMSILLQMTIPFGLLACVNVIDQGKKPLQAIIAAYNYIRHPGNFSLLTAIALMYSVPIIANILGNKFLPDQYLKLFTALWCLFCHILTIVVYVDSTTKATVKEDSKNKAATVVII